MKYSVKVNEVKPKEGKESNIRGFATVVFGDSFKITNIAILENKDKEQLFVSMPRYRSNERDENGGTIYKDVCNPITAEFREELYGNILEAYQQEISKDAEKGTPAKSEQEMPEFSVTVTPYEREGSSIRGLARVYFDDSFIVNNVSVLQGKDKLFVAMPAYKTKQVDEQGKPIYQDVAYPVTKEFREKLYGQIINEYEKAKEQTQDQAQEKASQTPGRPQEREATPFR
ncbi:MAG: SpoVG family protein [Anaerostipes sp.]|uniref:SpoVG family protein n=1 Tax=Enterocloster bolteae TaxID=208479 RepID=UPI00210ED1DF|nr:SpoVG family protein [Enterocloster bolteae]MCQ4754679.1 SpoVG family protein [Enterocloster bolteae]MDD4370702.1 SpoVG family protein [Anaerostipes sp.]